ncbi:hypothetical protein HOY80DRAFT_967982 [Tuber brumale]|nr:hypothetical protein HOY80DRAFT_967982 [Tuber brumale]
MLRTAAPTNHIRRAPTPDPLTRFAPNSYHPHHARRRRLNSSIPTISATAPAGTLAGSSRSISIERSSAQNILSSSNPAIARRYGIRIDSPPSHIGSDESPEYLQSWEDALVFGRVLGIAHIVGGDIYRAMLRTRGPGAFARDLFFDGRGTEEEERGGGEESSGDGDGEGGVVERFDERDFVVGEGVLGAIDSGYYSSESDNDDMSSITRVSTYRYSLAKELECGICLCRKISVQFRECSHALCAPCVKALWRSRVTVFNSCPRSFPCHLCRAEIKEVGKLRTRVPGFGNAYRHGEKRFTVWKWRGLKQWVSGGKEKKKKKKSLPSGVAGLKRRLGRKLPNARFINGRGL